ncbi:MAG: hypothetical protein FAF03_00600 [Epsilonproteobacteria bacterium]|nr:hypothetical protein [Campylobacterota bacterium]
MIKDDETLTQVTASGCMPLVLSKGAKRCTGLNTWAYGSFLNGKHFNRIILSANWRIVRKDNFQNSLKILLKHTDKLIVLGPSLEYKQSLPRLLVNLKENEESSQIYKTASAYNNLLLFDKAIQSYVNIDDVCYISTLNIECTKHGCQSVTKDGTPMNFDNGHLTHEGAQYILKQIEDEIFDRRKD